MVAALQRQIKASGRRQTIWFQSLMMALTRNLPLYGDFMWAWCIAACPLNASANTRTWVSVRLATSTASATREIKGWEDPSRGCASLGMENATMNGFDRNNVPPPVAGDASREVHKISEIPWSEVESSVKQARALRSAYVAAWLRKTIQSWASVFRRPGYMLPRPASRLRPSTQ